MHIAFKNTIPNNIILKLLSLILGYIIWSIMSQSHITTVKSSILLFFYNIPEKIKILAPKQVTIQLRGTKKVLHSLTAAPLAAHINAQTLHQGDNLILLSKTTLFLPKHVELLHTIPSPIVVSLEPS